MNLDNNYIVYISAANPKTDLGVIKKIKNFCLSAEDLGYKTTIINQHCRSLSADKQLFNKVFDTNAKYIILRSLGWCNLAILPQIIKARLQRRIVICDQPTPLFAQIEEIKAAKRSTFKRRIGCILTYLHGSFGFIPFNRIVQYAQESRYFSFGVRHKTLKIGNGINEKSSILREKKYVNNDRLVLVGVANVSIYHGYDRVIKAMAEFNKNNVKKAYFIIIGGHPDHSVIIELKKLVEQLGLSAFVEFCGFQEAEYITDKYSIADLAVGSLALFRKFLNESSILKIREYALAGIPFITAGVDPDFEGTEKFRFEVPNDDSIIPIVRVLESFEERRKLFTDEEIRAFATKHLSYKSKITKILYGL